MSRWIALAFASLLLACSGDDGGTSEAEVVCPPCPNGQICVVTCDGDGSNPSAGCAPNPLDCDTDGACTEECDQSICGGDAGPSPYSCQYGRYCPAADAPAFYCHGV